MLVQFSYAIGKSNKNEKTERESDDKKEEDEKKEELSENLAKSKTDIGRLNFLQNLKIS